MTDTRHKNANWEIPLDMHGRVRWEGIQTAVLMDIRDELQQLNHTLSCFRLRRMSDDIARIDKRLAKKFPLKPSKGRNR